MNYTNKLKAAMVLKGYGQVEMAKHLNISLNTFNRKLNRTVDSRSKKENIFTIDEAVKMAKLLDVSLDEIFLISHVA